MTPSAVGMGTSRCLSPTPNTVSCLTSPLSMPPTSPLDISRTLPSGAREILKSVNMADPCQPTQVLPLRTCVPMPLSVTSPSRTPFSLGSAAVRSASQRQGPVARPMDPLVNANSESASVSAPSAVVPPPVLPFSSRIMSPQVGSSLRGVRAASQSPQRSTLPANWAPRRGLAENPLATIGRATAVSRVTSSVGAATGGRTVNNISRHVTPTIVATVESTARSHSPDRIRSAHIVQVAPSPARSNRVQPGTASPVKPRQVGQATPVADDLSRVVQEVKNTRYEPYVDGFVVPHAAPYESDPLQLEVGVEVCLGDHQLRCLNVLGSGSYSIVWRAEVLGCNSGGETEGNSASCHGQGSRMLLEKEVALKDVLCKSNAVLRQSLFEVQLLLALERRVLLDTGPQSPYPLRLPRCFAYKVDSREEGWRVRTAMTRLPGEQLDDWLRRAAVAVTSSPGVPWTSQLQRGCVMAETLVRQIGPTLQRLAPLAWHRDVNSHNVLVSEEGTGKLLCQTPDDDGANASFWLIDLGLAVDARSWVSPEPNNQGGTWRVTDIGGDCRYWPASSWMVHLFGADYLAEREEYCRQYQWRLDSFGLGITAVELMCSTALAARLAGAEPVECECVSDASWARLLDAWQRFYDRAGNWWAEIYKVFSTGGDFRPVHAWLVEEQVADQVVALMEDLRDGLRSCMACATDEVSQRILLVVSELIDEASDYDLTQLCEMILQEDVYASEEMQLPIVSTTVPVIQPPPAESGAVSPIHVSEPNRRATPDVPLAKPAAMEPAANQGIVVEAGNEGKQEHTVEPYVGFATPPAAAQWDASSQPCTNNVTSAVVESKDVVKSGEDAPLPVCEAPQLPILAGEPPGGSPEELMQEAMALASAAANEGRQALASLNPIPSIAAGERAKRNNSQNARRSRQAELAELVDAQAQLRHDLERLQLAKMRLQHARRVHEEKKNSAAVMQGRDENMYYNLSPDVPPMGQTNAIGSRRPVSRPPPARGRSRLPSS